MIGTAVVLLLGGLLVPITLLVAALVFDALFVAWIAFDVSHDWAKRSGHTLNAALHRAGRVIHHRPSARHAH